MDTVETVQDQETVLDIKTILVAVDLSPHSERTVAYAVAIAGQLMGRHHQTFLGRLLNLDQASKIFHRVACPVLVWEGEEN
jgi:nucleotide-binding universal stress UspA family protein